ncbi:glycosyltransferase family 2 protein [Flaviaesturariibacter flavus]|uniref:Glycosyltransferase family 2 protein n=1 Tax=Flaviaesturariibacter flavus TaxID=2502780 RepID=A0A4V2NVE4_9BACT|nr:glycosyltransferase family 2 protein [Flaviaesturariibacter flavus]TCJ13106.1 glycosyltransferase family 2 protein [Flaviaesturariibacter flavus]
MSQPLISVVMCTYNGAAYLREQLDSLVAQTYANLEFVVCDDRSTDDTRAILEEYARDRRFRLFFNEENLGYSKNFARATALARGEYIAFCDQDDIWMHDKIEKLYRGINGHSLVYSDSLLVNAQGESLGKKLSDLRNLVSFSDTRSFALYNMVSGHTMLIERAVLEAGLPIPENAYHDWWFAIIAAGRKGGVYLNEVLAHYRQHDRNVTVNIVTRPEQRRRGLAERWRRYQVALNWMRNIVRVTGGEEQAFHAKLLHLYEQKSKGFSWPLFFFLVRHQELFRYRRKSLLSNLFEARILARGESPE